MGESNGPFPWALLGIWLLIILVMVETVVLASKLL